LKKPETVSLLDGDDKVSSSILGNDVQKWSIKKVDLSRFHTVQRQRLQLETEAVDIIRDDGVGQRFQKVVEVHLLRGRPFRWRVYSPTTIRSFVVSESESDREPRDPVLGLLLVRVGVSLTDERRSI